MDFDRSAEAQLDPVTGRAVAEPIGVVDVVYDVVAAVKKVWHAVENVVECSACVHATGAGEGVAEFAEVDQLLRALLRATAGGEGKPCSENDDGN